MRRIPLLFLTLLLALSLPVRAEWFKGQTHTHTINSDGDSSPDEVVRWYKEHRYHFVVISDHNFLTEVSGLNAVFAAEGKFLVLSGVEVSDNFVTSEGRNHPIHLNSIHHDRVILPTGGGSVADVLQKNVDKINANAGACTINHPNFVWALGLEDMLKVRNYNMFEIANYHPLVNNHGGGGHLSTEALWDSLLTSGRKVWGVASDDAHHFKVFGPQYANPGRGWVMVRAEKLEAEALVDALNRGDFYSSTGVELKEVRSDSRSLTIEIEGAGRGNTEYTVTFIGSGGRTLATELKSPAVYNFRGGEGYVRAKVVDSNGRIAWTQPVFP